MEIRNTLLVYRLLHFKDKITDIKLNIQNREKQLFKPVLRVFQSTQALEELRPVISKYISQRRESNANSLHAFLYRTVKELIEAQNTYELESGIIWNTVKDTLQGSDIPHKPQSYDSTEFGVLSQKDIVQTLREVFGAERSKRRTSRKLLFDPSKLERLSKIYDMSVDVQLVTHVAHVTHVGLDKHLQEHSDDKEFTASKHENANIYNEETENNEKITSQKDGKGSQSCADVPQASHMPQPQTEQCNMDYRDTPFQDHSELSNNTMEESSTKLLLNQGAYWSGSKWNCKSCKYSYDGPGMIQHLRLEHNQQTSRRDLERN
jgi:hypothetical protein